MKISRRDFMDGVSGAALMVSTTGLGLYLADRQPPEPPPVDLAADLRAVGAGHVSLSIAPLELKVDMTPMTLAVI